MKHLDITRLFGNKSNSASKTQQKRKHRRTCRIEELEGREMLDAGLFGAIKEAYTDLDLGNYWTRYNFIEIAANDISESALRNAIAQAGTTRQDDIIVVHTTETQNRITLGGALLPIHSFFPVWGSVTIVSLGDAPLTIDANQQSIVFSISTESVALAGLTITGGYTTDSGGGIHVTSDHLVIINCTIAGNTAGIDGGGIAYWNNSLTIRNSVISENVAGRNGGGIHGVHTSTPSSLTITNSTIVGNMAEGNGGGIIKSGTLTIRNSTIAGNFAGSDGGGIYFRNGNGTITNSTIVGNVVEGNGGGIVNISRLTIRNSTIAGNFAGNDGGGIYRISGSMELYNTIVAQNVGSDIHFSRYGDQGGNWGYNNLTAFTDWHTTQSGNNVLYDSSLPLFVDAENGDYRLAPGSQAIDRGNNTFAVTVPGFGGSPLLMDLAGNPRIINGTVDIGAYEYQDTATTPLVAPTGITATSANANSLAITWNWVPNATGYIIEYATNANFTDRQTQSISGQAVENAVLAGLTTGQLYYVRVIAVGDAIYYTNSPESAYVSATPISQNTDPVYNEYEWNLVQSQGLAEYATWENIDGTLRLTAINAQDRGLTGALNLSGCMELRYVNVSNNQLTALDLSNNVALLELWCTENQLVALDVSNLVALEFLACQGNRLITLDVYQNMELWYLDCNRNQLTVLDLSNNTALEYLYCGENQLEKLDVSKNTSLIVLSCHFNKLKYLDISTNTALEVLHCGVNQLTELDTTKNTALTELHANDNQLKKLDFSPNTVLRTLMVYNNLLAVLDVSNNTKLTFLNVYHNQLTFLDVSQNTDLKTLWCGWNQLAELDVSHNVDLVDLKVEHSLLTSIDVSKNTSLLSLWVQNNQLTTLDISNNTKLDNLQCSWNQLTVLDVSKNSALQELLAVGNQLTSLDVSNNAELTSLSVYYNQLTSLDVFNNTALTTLDVNNNQLAFSTLHLPVHSMTFLDVRNQVAMQAVLNAGNVVDVSSEYNINGTLTTYTWHYANGDIIDKNLYTESNGVFTFHGLQNGDVIYNTMTNAGFPGWMLQTTAVTISGKTEQITPPITPTGLASTSRTTDSITLSWNATTNATNYEIQYRTGNGNWTNVPITGTSTTIGNLTDNTSYEFQVRAVNNDGLSDWSQSVFATTDNDTSTQLSVPTGIAAASNGNRLTIGWIAVYHASGYIVEYDDGNGWQKVNASITRVEIPVAAGNVHIRITAVGTGDYSSTTSEVITITHTGLAPDDANRRIKAKHNNRTNGINWVNLTWEQVGGNFEYEIRNITTNETITVFDVTSYRWEDLDSHKSYRFEITIKNAAGDAANKVNITAKTARMERGTAPTKLRAIGGNNSVALNWTAPIRASGLDGYEIRVFGTTRHTTFSSVTIQVGSDTTSYLVSNLPTNERFRFEVYAVTSNEVGTVYSTMARVNATTTKPFPAVKQLRLPVKNPIVGTDVVLTWTALQIPGVSYQVGYLVGNVWSALPEGVRDTIELDATRPNGMRATITGMDIGRITLAVRAVIEGTEVGRHARINVNVRMG